MGPLEFTIAVELGYIAIFTAITGQIISAISVDVDAPAIEISCNPHITITVGGYTVTFIITSIADIFGYVVNINSHNYFPSIFVAQTR
ncbi:MAG: hypothetical protein MGU50_20490 [Trichodesmium sp. MAG_R02]|nr:hypothetical protein [Trichodesmium sp. MAG_R02]